MRDVFISGWCGFSSLFGSFADRFEFVVPFYDCKNISGVLKQGGRNLVCWSTGANLALKEEILDFENIILVSPFQRFTDYTPERVLKLMIRKFGTNPDGVIRDFLTACGCPDAAIDEISDYSLLGKGLEYLLDSGKGMRETRPKMTVIHGINDSVVDISSGRAVAEAYSSLFVPAVCGHFVPAEIISEYLI